jgi:hypothetical protein
MARFLLVLKPRSVVQPRTLIEALQPMLQALQAEVDHETIAHLSAVVRVSGEQQRMQLFADVQNKADGVVLELAIMSRESMGRGAPKTLAVFEELVKQAGLIAGVDVVFRSDRDGPIP